MTKEEAPEAPEQAPEQESNEDEREKIPWPYTKGDSSLSFRFFDLVDLPEFLDEEDSGEGKLVMALISEILHLKGSLAVLIKERQKASFEQWLSTQGKGLRNPGAPSNIMSMMKTRK